MDEKGGKKGPDVLGNLHRMYSGHVTMIIKNTFKGNKLALFLDQSGELAVFVSPNDRNRDLFLQIGTDGKGAYFVTGMEIDLKNGGIGETGHDGVVGRLVGEWGGRGGEAESRRDGAKEGMSGADGSNMKRMDSVNGDHQG